LKLVVRKNGGNQMEYLRYCFTGVHVASIRDGFDDEAPTETVEFNYQTIVEHYTMQAPSGDTGEVFGGFDYIRNIQFGDPNSC
jgi:type VI protein secretion system component Hcp